MNDVIVRLVPLPTGSDACVLEDPAGDYNVYISDDLDSVNQRRAYIHELMHIIKGHLDDDLKSSKECESEIRDELQLQLELRSKCCSVVRTDGFCMPIISRGEEDGK